MPAYRTCPQLPTDTNRDAAATGQVQLMTVAAKYLKEGQIVCKGRYQVGIGYLRNVTRSDAQSAALPWCVTTSAAVLGHG